MTTTKLNKLAVAFGAAGVLAATLAATMTPALGAARGATHPATTSGPTLRYIDGTNVSVPANSVGQNATKCPRGMYPIGGGPSSPSALWLVHWSDPDRSVPSAAHPDEWTVALFNNTNSTQVFKVFVVCSTAQKVTSNY